MRKILIITTVSSTIRSFLLPFAKHFRTLGWRVDAMAHGVSVCAECIEAFDQVWEIDLSRNPLHPRNLVVAPRQILKLINRERYNLVHVHTPVAAFITRYALRHLRSTDRPKVIYTAHGFHFHPEGNLLKNLIYLIAEKITGHLTDYLIVINDEDYQVAKKYKLLPLERLIRMYGVGIDTNFYDPEKLAESTAFHLRHFLKIPIKAPIIIMISEFNKNKRHIDLIKALSMIIKKKEIYAIFVGGGLLFLKSKRFVEKLNLSHYIRFLGYRKDIRSLIKISTIVVLPSLREGLPVNVMEALSMETAVIATNIRGTRELLSNGCGSLIPPKSPQILANAILDLLDDLELRINMGKIGRKKMQRKYEISKIISQYNDIYESLVK